MPPLIFECPISGQKVQAFVAEDMIGTDTTRVPIDCPLCRRPHLIDPRTGAAPASLDD
jgi:hypothetical protein